MNKLKKFLGYLKALWASQYLSFNILVLVLMMCYVIMIFATFQNHLDHFANLSIIRTVFSSIMGYMLESSTRHVLKCKANAITIRNIIVGFITIVSVIVVAYAYFNAVSVDNPTLVLIKNNLFTCIGFLISTSEKCSSDN